MYGQNHNVSWFHCSSITVPHFKLCPTEEDTGFPKDWDKILSVDQDHNPFMSYYEDELSYMKDNPDIAEVFEKGHVS